jgi:hypothetical protein
VSDSIAALSYCCPLYNRSQIIQRPFVRIMAGAALADRAAFTATREQTEPVGRVEGIMAYFISPPNDSDLQIQVEDLLQKLRARWPNMRIDKYVDPGYLVSWEVKIGDYWEPGGLQSDRQAITIQDHPECAAIFAVWYRSHIPSIYKLFMYHDSSVNEHELLPTMTEEELLDELASD